MAQTFTNNLGLAYTFEDQPQQLETDPIWKILEANTVETFGATNETVVRRPIGPNRRLRKGSIVNRTSAFDYSTDLTTDMLQDWIRGFMYSKAQGPMLNVATPRLMDFYVSPSAVSTSAYTLASAVTAAPAIRTLVHGAGFSNAANNGLKQVATAATTTSVPIEGGGLVVETPTASQNATLRIAGHRFTTGDLEVNADGNLTTTTKDLTELNLVRGQSVYLGSTEAINRFDTAANSGVAEVVSVTANLLTLKNRSQTYAADTGTGKEIDLLFGPVIKDVPVGDSLFLENTIQVEGTFVNLRADQPGDSYTYSEGNNCNVLSFSIPAQNKAEASIGFIGRNTVSGVFTRRQNAATARQPVGQSLFNTSSDILRLRINQLDETGVASVFSNSTLNINNNVNTTGSLAFLGSRFTSVGLYEVSLESEVFLDDPLISQEIDNFTTLSMDFIFRNDDGGFHVSFPACTMGDGALNLPVDQPVTVNTTVSPFEDPILRTTMMVTLFPYLPPAS